MVREVEWQAVETHWAISRLRTLMKSITVLGYRRPEYLGRCLSALSKCRGIANYRVLVSIDGGSPKRQECREVAQGYPWTVRERTTNYGINEHNRVTYDDVFSDTSVDFNVAVEDDGILSPDALELADWFYTLESRDEYICASLGVIRKTVDDPSAVSEFIGLGTSWGFCFTRIAWEKMRTIWNCKRHVPTGWDWSLTYAMYINHWKALFPHLSRIANIGRLDGVNAYPKWFDENMAGTVASDGSFRGKYQVVSRLSPGSWKDVPQWMAKELEAL